MRIDGDKSIFFSGLYGEEALRAALVFRKMYIFYDTSIWWMDMTPLVSDAGEICYELQKHASWVLGVSHVLDALKNSIDKSIRMCDMFEEEGKQQLIEFKTAFFNSSHRWRAVLDPFTEGVIRAAKEELKLDEYFGCSRLEKAEYILKKLESMKIKFQECLYNDEKMKKSYF